jgi:L-Ala-D/L-Glu epimerase
LRITSVQTTAVRVPLREPLKWTGGIRESASGLILEIRTDEGLVGIGEAPGPTLPAIQTIIDRELAQFLVDQDPLRVEWILHRLEEYSRNWAGLAAYAIAGVEMALLDLKGQALGVSVAELLGGYSRESIPVIGYLFIDEPEANARKAAEFVAAGHTELKLKVGRDLAQDHDSIAAIRDSVGYDVKLRIDANMNWSVPAAIKWIKALERYDLQYVEQPVPDFDIAGLAQVRRSVSVPIAADEACTTLRSALELIKADACDIFVVYPSEAGGLTRALQIAALATAAGKWCAIGSWAELGVATTANAHLAAAAASSFPFANDTHYPLQLHDVLIDAVEIRNGCIAVSHDPGLGVALDAASMATLSALELRESPFYDDIQGDAPSVGQIL